MTKNTKKITNWNPTLTVEEARELYTFKGVAVWKNTDHNKKLMKQMVTETLKELRNA